MILWRDALSTCRPKGRRNVYPSPFKLYPSPFTPCYLLFPTLYPSPFKLYPSLFTIYYSSRADLKVGATFTLYPSPFKLYPSLFTIYYSRIPPYHFGCMPIRLIALDLDGTLINSRWEISQKDLDALAPGRQQGIQIVLVTGRRARAAAAYVAKIPFPITLITSNGARILTPRARWSTRISCPATLPSRCWKSSSLPALHRRHFRFAQARTGHHGGLRHHRGPPRLVPSQ